MRVRSLLAASVIAGMLLVRMVAADPVGPHLEITPFAGATLFDGDLRVNGNPLINDLYLGGRVGYQLHSQFGLEAAFGYTPTMSRDAGEEVDFTHFSGSLMWTPWQGLHGGPYALLGYGSSQVKPSGGESVGEGAIEVGGGWKLWFSDKLGLRLEARQLYHRLEEPGLPSSWKINHMILGGGLVFALGGKARDTDLDGVPDRKDDCPNTPKGATVDAKGCPKDSDGDGVLDGLDKCAGTPTGCTIDATGCQTDADGDGVCDGLDKCADTPKGATVDATGCPGDSDGDGVLDGIDQCANTPKGATVDARGCPSDGDNDGVPDGLDKCPATALGLRVDKDGCPIEVMEKETELLDTGMIRLQNVNFETNKANVLPESFPVLDVVGQVLRQWIELRIEIGGHTDSRGTNAHNQRLSEARADSVKSYLTRKFPELKPGQFSTKGYGESRPLVPNNSDLNMAKNRRVEFVVQNRDVLRKEIERRRLLRQNEAAPPDTTGKKP